MDQFAHTLNPSTVEANYNVLYSNISASLMLGICRMAVVFSITGHGHRFFGCFFYMNTRIFKRLTYLCRLSVVHVVVMPKS